MYIYLTLYNILTVDELFRVENKIGGGHRTYDSYADIYERLRKGMNVPHNVIFKLSKT